MRLSVEYNFKTKMPDHSRKKGMENSSVYKSLIGENRSPRKTSTLPTWRLFLSAVLVAFGGPFNFGYQLLITNPSQEAFLQFLNDSHLQSHDDPLSREQLEISHSIQIAACALTILSFYETDAVIYSIARFLLGFGITISCGIAPMFITECSPKECRGVTSMMNGILLQIALVVGAILAMPQLFGTGDDWWKLYATELAITATVMALMPFIHDSPGYLHSRADDDRSEQALRFYHNIDGEELRATLKQLDQSTTEIQGIGLVSVWKDRAARRGTLVGAVVGISMVMSGIAAINAFSFEILLSTGLSVEQASIGNIAICMMSVTGILFSSLIIDRFGRRTLLLSTYGLLAVINLVIAGLMFGFQRGQSTSFGYPLLAAVCLFNLVFAAGPGPMALFITGELVDQNARGAACTWATVFMCTVYVPSSYFTSFCQKQKEERQRKFRIVGEIYRQLAKEDGGDLLHFQYLDMRRRLKFAPKAVSAAGMALSIMKQLIYERFGDESNESITKPKQTVFLSSSGEGTPRVGGTKTKPLIR
ncbi:transporter, major facilitator family protein [Teladorsagia circumcincta]|uniref:Transporter, major facilitator family protein n=1 Tax=Teladorsagia circumcincta TaxID=45464 RepID=A0A2G9UMR9_TELCI|nr:transporter, major facilitator family protein [Teladorsagia circumcincta]